MNINDTYSIIINKESKPNIFKFYDYQETSIVKLVCLYNQENNKIVIIYQCPNKIKYISLTYKESFFTLVSDSTEIAMKSFEHKEYDVNSILDLSSYGFLNVENIARDGVTETFGIDFYNTLMENNVLIPEKSFHTNYKNIIYL